MKKLLLLIVFSMIYADPPNWEDSPWEYEYTASLVGVVSYDEEQMADEGDIFAAFDEDGNVRGLGIALFVPFGPYINSTLWEFTLRSNEEVGNILSFQYYDASQDAILDIVETYTFIADEILGSLVNPLEFTAVFLEDEDGCTDSTASNYNPEANIDDGSCEYEECLFEDLDGDSFDDTSYTNGFITGYSDGVIVGMESVDITIDNEEVYNSGFSEGSASVDINNDGLVDEFPVISIVDGNAMVLIQGSLDEYTDSGANCSDQEDGDLSNQVEVSGELVNINNPGSYILYYNCSDSDGNAAQTQHRTVFVVGTLIADENGDGYDDDAFLAGAQSGDVNGDGSLNIVDIVFSIDMILNAE